MDSKVHTSSIEMTVEGGDSGSKSSKKALTQSMLDSLNVPQMKDENLSSLEGLGGSGGLAKLVGVNLETGLTDEQVRAQREAYGNNAFPESPMDSFFELLLAALSDTTLLILLFAAGVSLVIGCIEDPSEGWIEGCAIFIAVFLVANISAGNDYSKQLQFKALEASTAEDERTSVFRDGFIERINPIDLVVGDIIVLQAGDMVPADSVLLGQHVMLSNESSLTGEPDDLKKTAEKDPFLLSSCLITKGEDCRAMVIGIGKNSQWGKIKENLATEAVNTPLQDKLEEMTTQIGYIGMGFALATFIALVVQTFVHKHDILHGFIEAFIISITVVVVAIPEGLPLAVTISLAYSTKKMYQDQCFIRVLAACETMGNATNICSDKTGTLTENRMTVVEGWFCDAAYSQENFLPVNVPETTKKLISEHVSVNRQAYLVYKDAEGKPLHAPQIIGNKTEGALIMMAKSWGFDDEELKKTVFNEETDKIFSFNSAKKRSTAVLMNRPDRSVRILVKGASEWVLKDCTHYMDQQGQLQPMTPEKVEFLDTFILQMADRALRTLCLAHKDLKNSSELQNGWEENPPDNSDLCLDCIVGIIDPLRGDVVEAVRIAQAAGVTVRMVTGDNIATASAIARQCGILTEGGKAIEGPSFRKMTPAELDEIINDVQVMARSSPDDKYLLVTRLNGHGIPDDKEEWEESMKNREGVTWEKHRDLLLPGYREEWEAARPEGGDVVGVTGDGTNDAPALKAADVGLAMGITGTKVAQGASDIVILDDKFSSIVRAISWGRCVYDNIRKFLQFQLTVNVVALLIVFIGAVVGFGEPLNAVQLLWVNLVMDTMGALALGTEGPVPAVLERRPYKRNSSLVSRPMWRNILVQSFFQVIALLILMYQAPVWFDIPEGIACGNYKLKNNKDVKYWDIETAKRVDTQPANNWIDCSSYKQYCEGHGTACLMKDRNMVDSDGISRSRSLLDFKNFEDGCLECIENSYVHGSILFNTFIFAQVFNEYNARKIFDELNMMEGVMTNYIFILVSIITVLCQIFLIEVGGDFTKTSHLPLNLWLITMGIGAISLPLGVLMRFIPVVEDPNAFFQSSDHSPAAKKLEKQKSVKNEGSSDSSQVKDYSIVTGGEP